MQTRRLPTWQNILSGMTSALPSEFPVLPAMARKLFSWISSDSTASGLRIAVARQPGVHGNEIVGAQYFHAVAGIIDHGPVGFRRFTGESAQGAEHLIARCIVDEHHRRETNRAQRPGNRLGVVFRIEQCADVFVGGIADDERNPAARRGAGNGRRNGERRRRNGGGRWDARRGGRYYRLRNAGGESRKPGTGGLQRRGRVIAPKLVA